jgi:hypothetical protein
MYYDDSRSTKHEEINFDKHFDYIDEDGKPTVWLCHLEGKEGRADKVEDGIISTGRKVEEEMKVFVVI